MLQDNQKVVLVTGGDPTRVIKVQVSTGDSRRYPNLSNTGVSGKDQSVQIVSGGDPTRIPIVRGLDPVPGLNPAARFVAGLGQTVTGSGVSQWDDQSGNGRHLLQGTDSARPALQADGSVLFNGTAHFMKCNAFTLNQPTTVIAAIKQVSWTGSDRLFDGNSVNTGACYQQTSTPNLAIYSGTEIGLNGGLAIGTTGVLAVTFNGASSSIRVNNGAPVTGNSGASNMGGFALGSRADGATFWSNIQAYEVIVLPSAPSTAQLDSVISYLAGRYGVA